jgi:hypothetical protein
MSERQEMESRGASQAHYVRRSQSPLDERWMTRCMSPFPQVIVLTSTVYTDRG